MPVGTSISLCFVRSTSTTAQTTSLQRLRCVTFCDSPPVTCLTKNAVRNFQKSSPNFELCLKLRPVTCFKASTMAQALVTKAIQENAIMVFSKSYCPHCVRAKRVLDAELGHQKYAVLELERRSDCSAIQDYLSKLTGARTVPRVFIQGGRLLQNEISAATASSNLTGRQLCRAMHWRWIRNSTAAEDWQAATNAETSIDSKVDNTGIKKGLLQMFHHRTLLNECMSCTPPSAWADPVLHSNLIWPLCSSWCADARSLAPKS